MTFRQHGELLRSYCTADSGLFTTTRSAPTLSTSSVISSLTKSSAFVTSQRLYSSTPTVCVPQTGPQLSAFQQMTVDEVRKLLTSMPCKTSPLDILPCSLLKDCADVFAPVIARLANLSLQAGTFPAWFKSTDRLDKSSPANYRLISNLSTVSKLLERPVQARLRPHLTNSTFQSAYRLHVRLLCLTS